jgi:hypothetical protein
MPKARHDGDVLGGERVQPAFSFDSEDITFSWDPGIPEHGGLRSTAPGGAKVVLRPSVAVRPTWLGKQYRHSWHVSVNGVDLYRDIWSDEQLPEPVLRSIVRAAIAASEGLLQRFEREEQAARMRERIRA